MRSRRNGQPSKWFRAPPGRIGSFLSTLLRRAPARTGDSPRDDRDRFDKFTVAARDALMYADEEARRMKDGHLGVEHLLLGLTHGDCGIPPVILGTLGASRSVLLTMMPASIRRDALPSPDVQRVLTPPAKRAIELAVGEARMRAMSYVAPEHLLLGVLRVLAQFPSERANEVLHRLNVRPDEISQRTQIALDHSRRFVRKPFLVSDTRNAHDLNTSATPS
jgi:ATP-dependent Clp protease ATP-binding subunit ClpA